MNKDTVKALYILWMNNRRYTLVERLLELPPHELVAFSAWFVLQESRVRNDDSGIYELVKLIKEKENEKTNERPRENQPGGGS